MGLILFLGNDSYHNIKKTLYTKFKNGIGGFYIKPYCVLKKNGITVYVHAGTTCYPH